jgi:SAM-dependent methyltransferase
MHPTSLENMQKCYDRYVASGLLATKTKIEVLDIGGTNINGSYRSIFAGRQFCYRVADIVSDPSVDIVLSDPYRLPLPNASVDIVLSGQMLEHCEFFWLTFQEMVRVLKQDGFIFLIAPSTGPIHRYPVDCYRFYPDAYAALAKYTHCNLQDIWHDERGPWQDLVGVFTK